MKTKRNLRISALLCLFVLYSITTFSQVTIGSDKEPATGVLLQLDSTEKGLGMPRVELQHPNKLQPMFAYENASNTPSREQEEGHTGLVIYNVREDYCHKIPLLEGLNVWTGEKWENISNLTPFKIGKLVDDRDPNNPETYRTGDFGDAGVWMLENLRANRWPDGTTTGKGDLYRMTENHDYYKDKAAFSTVNRDDEFYKEHPEYGLLYNAKAAHWFETSIEGTAENENYHRQMQGICPNDWHIPRGNDFVNLIKIANQCKYGDRKDSATNVTTNLRSKKKVVPHPSTLDIPEPTGLSRPITEGGFELYLSGVIATYDKDVDTYGKKAMLRSSTSNPGNVGSEITLEVLNDKDIPYFWNGYSHKMFYSVRCIKDGTGIYPNGK